jgi:hypothetical protein
LSVPVAQIGAAGADDPELDEPAGAAPAAPELVVLVVEPELEQALITTALAMRQATIPALYSFTLGFPLCRHRQLHVA